MTAVRVNDQFLPDFLTYALCQEDAQNHLKANTTGMALSQTNFTHDALLRVPILSPSLLEQKKIASILTSVDEVIETTQKQIDKLQDLKKATMNELLTKGIGHTEFKDSELGRIPKSWEVTYLGKSVKNPICYGIVQVGDYDPKGVRVIAIKYLGKINESHLHRSKKSVEEKYKRSRIKVGDLLISIKGTIGRMDIVPDDFVGNISRDIAKISLSSDYIPEVIQAFLESSVGKSNIAQTTVGTTRAELSIGRLTELKIPKIPLNEQIIIKQIYYSFNIEISTKFKKLAQTQSLKKSLMQDLLTGKVRVQVN
jgi:type I restriction enzyme, S subunit